MIGSFFNLAVPSRLLHHHLFFAASRSSMSGVGRPIIFSPYSSPVGSTRRWAIFFSPRAQYWWQRWLQKECRHCFFLAEQDHGLLLCDPLAPNLQIFSIPNYLKFNDIINHYCSMGCRVVVGLPPAGDGLLSPSASDINRGRLMRKSAGDGLPSPSASDTSSPAIAPLPSLATILISIKNWPNCNGAAGSWAGRFFFCPLARLIRWVFVRTIVTWLRYVMPPFGIYTCVSVTKSFLAIKNPFLLTPYQLFLFLQKNC